MNGEIAKITTHAEDARKRLLFQYADKEKFKSMLDAYFGNQIQDLEDAMWTLFGRLDLGTVSGIQLDGIGAIVGEPRQGKGDAEYLVYITARIGVNTSEGDIETVLDIWEIITQCCTVQLIEVFPASIMLYMTDPLSSDAFAVIVLDLLQGVVGAGIKVDFIEVYDPDEAFGFDSSGPTTAGFGNLLSQGTNTSVSSGKLIDSGATFQTDSVDAGDYVYNNTDKTWAIVVTVDSQIQLTLDSHIFTGTGKGYTINEDADVGGKLAWIQAPATP